MMRCPYRVHGIHHGLALLLDGAVPSCDMHTHIRNSRPFYIWHHAMILYNYEIPVCARVQMTALLLMRNRHRRHDFLIMMGTITLFRRSSMSASISLSSCLPTSKVRSRISVFYQNDGLFGGGVHATSTRSKLWTHAELKEFVETDTALNATTYRFVRYGSSTVISKPSEGCVLINLPPNIIAARASKKVLLQLCVLHQIVDHHTHDPVESLRKLILEHKCEHCISDVCEFRPRELRNTKATRDRKHYLKTRCEVTSEQPTVRDHIFPPDRPSEALLEDIASGFANGQSFDAIKEQACAVCGMLTPVSMLSNINSTRKHLDILNAESSLITRKERRSAEDALEHIPGPVVLPECSDVCLSCSNALKNDQVPADALANGLWIGEVPEQLQGLTWTEKMMISRVKHNYCVVRVASSRMHKMRANAVCHSIPMPEVYDALPPSLAELDEVLAFLYIGPSKPTKQEYARTPLLVRRQKVTRALEWLKLNHVGYKDLDISYRNVNSYPEDEPPVVVDYHQDYDATKQPESTAVNDIGDDDGTSEGPCPFVVHGLTSDSMVNPEAAGRVWGGLARPGRPFHSFIGVAG